MTSKSVHGSYYITRDLPPFDFYEGIRSEHPRWDDGVGAWLVTDFETCRSVLRNENLFERADRHIQGGREIRPPRAMSVMVGREHHTRHRMLSMMLKGSYVHRYEETYVRPIAVQLLSRFTPDERADLRTQYAFQLPLRVGVASVGGDPWDEALIDELSTAGHMQDAYRSDPTGATHEETDTAIQGMIKTTEILRRVVGGAEERDGRVALFLDDIDSRGERFVTPWDEEERAEAVHAVYSGGETRYALCQAIYQCVDDPRRQKALRNADEEMEVFVEECLRLDGPVHFMGRVCVKDTELNGVPIHKGDRVLVMLASANRDPDIYSDPDVHHIQLDRSTPEHLAFGFGSRYCPGATLARIEMRVAMEELLKHCGNIRWAEGADHSTLHGFHVRSYSPLAVTFTNMGA